MKRINLNVFLLSLSLVLSHYLASAQNEPSDTLTYRNSIKLNLTPIVLVNAKNLNFNYERILNDTRSVSVNFGITQIDYFVHPDSIKADFLEAKKRLGYSIAADYRFYLTDRNKYAIPDGLYWGFYANRHWYNNVSTLVFDGQKDPGKVDTRFSITSLGIELGYQLTFRKRWTVDMLLVGPNYSLYSLSMDISGSINQDFIDQFKDKLIDRFPQFVPLVSEIIDSGGFDAHGRLNIDYFGFRYLLQVGYRF